MQTTNIFCNLNNASMPVMPSMPSRPAMQNKNHSLPSRGPIIERYRPGDCNEDNIGDDKDYYLSCDNGGTPGFYIGKEWKNCYQHENGSWSQVDGDGAAKCERN